MDPNIMRLLRAMRVGDIQPAQTFTDDGKVGSNHTCEIDMLRRGDGVYELADVRYLPAKSTRRP